MNLVDTGRLVAQFDPRDWQHDRCVKALERIREPVSTTVPVLTEAFHMLRPESPGSDGLREFVEKGRLAVWLFCRASLTPAFELMERYADHPMDLADASILVAAESYGDPQSLYDRQGRLRDIQSLISGHFRRVILERCRVTRISLHRLSRN